jgi:hypothetical protein
MSRGFRSHSPLWCGPQHIVWELAGKSSGLQTLSVGSKLQMIGAKEQGPKRACGCPPAYIRFASPSIPLAEQLQDRCRENSVRQYVPETAKRSVTWAAKAHMKLAFERIERNPHRHRFASALMPL